MHEKRRVLVVDDDHAVAETLAAVLRLHDFEVLAVHSGKAAVQMAVEFQPEALIADIVMPGMNGLETAAHIRSLFPSCKITLITGRSTAADMVLQTHALQDGFELLAKPVHPRDLLARL